MRRWIFSLAFAAILGCSLTFLFLYQTERFIFWNLGWEFWGLAALASAIALGASVPQRQNEPEPAVDFSEFEKEYRQALKAHLKISILFWSYFYKKEKVKTLDEAKKEVFQDLRKEFPPSLDPLLEEIKTELQKYK